VTDTPLEGGYVSNVVRVGDTIRRRSTKPRPFAREVLAFLGEKEWSGAPRHLGSDDEGREVLTYIAGYVPWDGANAPIAVWQADSIASVARLARAFHDLTAGTDLSGDAEVVCHNDLSPRNTVYDPDMRAIAFIDWDLAEPGRRVHDVALMCWQWCCGTTSPLDAACELIAVIADSYDCAANDRAELVETILWWQDRCWRGIQAGIDAGDSSFDRLRAMGAVPAVQADWEWTHQHRAALEAALR
jgi:hypothetical protein